MSKLQNVDPKHDFVAMENRLLKWWEEQGILTQYMEKNRKSKKKFGFIDGPITANNEMGLHHAWGRTYKDLVSRYKNMQGFEQRFQMGFDCQGLWVEVEVEKALGFNSKKDIFDYGMDKFVNACKDRVYKYSKIQTDQSVRLGMFMDWENSYYTMSEENNLYIWNFLKVCQQKGLLYKSHSSTTWCPRCETGLSEHEKADGYADIVDTSVYVKFKVKGKENEYLLAWTTTPWTLSANVLLAVHPELEYVKAKDGNSTYYLAAKPAGKLGFKDVESVDVKTLVGMKFESLYDIPAQEGVDHYVVEWDLVSENDGSGIVHIAPGCGQEDYELGMELKVPALSPLDETGHYMNGYGDLTGKYAHDVKDEVISYLKSEGLLFKTEDYKHTYPHCWRCKTKCLFRLENNWFINISKIREDLKKAANEAKWTPEFGGKRMQDWLRNMGDWMISRKRFYGLALPFYECECGEVTVVSGKEELKQLATDPGKVDKLESIHRPWIDEVTIKCPKCSKEVKRVADVGDCWLDAGVVPFSTLKYLEDKKYWKKWFPGDFITEMVEQVRLWFYSMLVFGVVMEDKVPYRVVVTYAEMRDENNNKMSKTKKNYVPFNEAADKVGADLIRWNFCLSPFGKNVRFGWNVVEDARRQFLLPFWNSYSYFVTYANMHSWKFDPKFDASKLTNIMDRWIVARLGKLVEEVTNDMDQYSFYGSANKMQAFVVDLSTWYIRRSRDRFKVGNKDALNTLYFVLVELNKMLAPFVPFVTEEMYQNLVVNGGNKDAKMSVHLESFPEVKEVDEKVLEDMEVARGVASLGLKVRDEKRLKLRQPLAKAYVNLNSEELKELVRLELNVKEVESSEKAQQGEGMVMMEGNGYFVTLDTNLTEELKQEGLYRELVRQLQDLRKRNGLQVGQQVAALMYSESKEVENLVGKFDSELRQDVSLSDIKFAKNDGESVNFDSFDVNVTFEK
ncbi:isoleucine--tRNA ligase [bacterium]|nr:isoleucine--tRNA ligase [bacterium]